MIGPPGAGKGTQAALLAESFSVPAISTGDIFRFNVKNETELGKQATLIQFSTQFCGQCPGVRRQLAQLEHRHGGLTHLEVDITDRLNVAARFGINQTPTVFLLNSQGELVYRVGGVPNLTKLNQELEKLGVK